MQKFNHLKQVVEQISDYKKEPKWMKRLRLQALKSFEKIPMPNFGGNLTNLDFNKINYFVKSGNEIKHAWKDVPKEIRETYDKLGIPKTEQKFLAGIKTQWNSEMIYGSLLKDLEKRGVIFLSMEEGLQKYPNLVKKYFGTIVPLNDNKFASLNSAAWSGGCFIYIPPKISINLPLQAYFRINAKSIGQFERTLIIADEGSFVHYVEGCTSPIFTSNSLHAGVVEIIVKKGARVRYTTIQNWSKNVYNLVTKRAKVEEEGIMEWVDFNNGSKLTMKYPSALLVGKGAKVDMLSLAMAGAGQQQDTGGKAIHLASQTTSIIRSKSISHKGGITSYRGLVKIAPGIKDVKSKTVCQALILDDKSQAQTYPAISAIGPNCELEHEAKVSKISEEQIFYLQSRGIDKDEAETMIVNGFIKPLVKELPMEYAIELNQLIRLEMKGSVL